MTPGQIASYKAARAEYITASDVLAASEPAIKAGDIVRAFVNDFGGDVTGTVLDAYTNAADTLVADVQLPGRRLFTQNVEFLTLIGASE